MTEHQRSDDEIIALTRKKFRQRKIGLLLLMLPAMLIGGAVGWKFAAWHLGHHPTPLLQILALGICAVFLVGAFVAILYFTRPPPGAYDAHILARRVDELEWQIRRFLLVVVPFSLLILAVIAEAAIVRIPNRADGFDDTSYFGPALFILMGIMVLSFLTPYGIKRAARPVLNNELSKAQRASALALGYWIATPCLAALLLLALYSRNLAVEMMIPALYLVIAVPALRYCYLDWRASREN